MYLNLENYVLYVFKNNLLRNVEKEMYFTSNNKQKRNAICVMQSK